MASPGRDLLETSTAWMDAFWDEEAGLLWTVKRNRHLVRETASYALGLLQRAEGRNVSRAHKAIDAVLDHQFTVDGPYRGTFRRSPEEPDPPSDAVMWLHYDPNWRQFIGTALAVIVDRFELPDALRERALAAISLAVDGEPPDRVVATYSNIALMKAWLDRWEGQRTGDAERVATGTRLAHDIASHFDEHGAFLEYNSPTYYGIDLWALALWRTSDGPLADLGVRIERELWRDVARFYHADLRNLCGPYDRAYGMDMTRYAAVLGLWIWAVTGRTRAPFPDPASHFGHPHDMTFGPFVTVVDGPDIPNDVLPHLTTFGGERVVDRTVTTQPRRRATAWLGPHAMFGAHTGPPSGIGWLQHHHATAHVRAGDGRIWWARLLGDTVADAVASTGHLEIEAGPETALAFELGGSTDADTVSTDGWAVGGTTIDVETNASSAAVEADGSRLVVRYEPSNGGTTRVALRLAR